MLEHSYTEPRSGATPNCNRVRLHNRLTLDPADIPAFRSLWDGPLPCAEIGAQYGVSGRAVSRAAHRYGFQRRQSPIKLCKNTKAQIAEVRRQQAVADADLRFRRFERRLAEYRSRTTFADRALEAFDHLPDRTQCKWVWDDGDAAFCMAPVAKSGCPYCFDHALVAYESFKLPRAEAPADQSVSAIEAAAA